MDIDPATGRDAESPAAGRSAADPWVRLAHLYPGRRDVQGTESGGSLRRAVNYGHYRGHLQGRFGLGIYPLSLDGMCAWAAVDIDTGDLDRALQLRRLLHDHELPGIVLTSRSKGYHVLVFFEGRARRRRHSTDPARTGSRDRASTQRKTDLSRRPCCTSARLPYSHTPSPARPRAGALLALLVRLRRLILGLGPTSRPNAAAAGSR